MPSDRTRALGLVAASLLLLGSTSGCRSDLLAPSSPEPFVQDAVLVRPFVRVIDEYGAPARDVDVRSDSGFYRSGAGSLSFRVDGDVAVWPEAVPAPFVVEVRRFASFGSLFGSGTYYRFDVFPADGETLVVDLRSHDSFVGVDLAPALPTADVEVDHVSIEIEVSNQSAHVEVDLPRTRTYEFSCVRVDTLLYATDLPDATGDTWYARAEWSTREAAPGPFMRGYVTASGQRTPGELHVELASRLVPMDLQLTWAHGEYPIDDFTYETFPRILADDREYVSVEVQSDDAPSVLPGLPGDVTFDARPTRLRAVLGSRTTRTWNGVDPVRIDLGRHACTVRVVDANGRPRAFEAYSLDAVSADLRATEQTTDASGRMLWYVNDGEYVLRPTALRSDPLGPRGGPWRVTSDTTLVWELP